MRRKEFHFLVYSQLFQLHGYINLQVNFSSNNFPFYSWTLSLYERENGFVRCSYDINVELDFWYLHKLCWLLWNQKLCFCHVCGVIIETKPMPFIFNFVFKSFMCILLDDACWVNTSTIQMKYLELYTVFSRDFTQSSD